MNQFAQLRELMKVQCDMATQPYKIKAQRAEAESKATMSEYTTNQLKFQLEDRERDKKVNDVQAKIEMFKQISELESMMDKRAAQLRNINKGKTPDYSKDPQYRGIKAEYDALCSAI
jgi:hypothetical protein